MCEAFVDEKAATGYFVRRALYTEKATPAYAAGVTSIANVG